MQSGKGRESRCWEEKHSGVSHACHESKSRHGVVHAVGASPAPPGEVVPAAGRSRAKPLFGAWPRAPRNVGWRKDLCGHPNLRSLVGFPTESCFYPEHLCLPMRVQVGPMLELLLHTTPHNARRHTHIYAYFVFIFYYHDNF
jgi:hypothetical protein